jgi:hypothetical protein
MANEVTETARGTKPGDPLADFASYCLMFACALKEIHMKLKGKGAAIERDIRTTMDSLSGDDSERVTFMDVSFADDSPLPRQWPSSLLNQAYQLPLLKEE